MPNKNIVKDSYFCGSEINWCVIIFRQYLWNEITSGKAVTVLPKIIVDSMLEFYMYNFYFKCILKTN